MVVEVGEATELLLVQSPQTVCPQEAVSTTVLVTTDDPPETVTVVAGKVSVETMVDVPPGVEEVTNEVTVGPGTVTV